MELELYRNEAMNSFVMVRTGRSELPEQYVSANAWQEVLFFNFREFLQLDATGIVQLLNYVEMYPIKGKYEWVWEVWPHRNRGLTKMKRVDIELDESRNILLLKPCIGVLGGGHRFSGQEISVATEAKKTEFASRINAAWELTSFETAKPPNDFREDLCDLMDTPENGEASTANVENIKAVFKELRVEGYFGCLSDDDISTLMEIAIVSNDVFHDGDGRTFELDNESVLDQGLWAIHDVVQPFLNLGGMDTIDIKECLAEDGHYAVVIDGHQYVLWEADEVHGLKASEAANRACAALNDVLFRRHRQDLLYCDLVYERIVFLSESMYEILCRRGFVEKYLLHQPMI